MHLVERSLETQLELAKYLTASSFEKNHSRNDNSVMRTLETEGLATEGTVRGDTHNTQDAQNVACALSVLIGCKGQKSTSCPLKENRNTQKNIVFRVWNVTSS